MNDLITLLKTRKNLVNILLLIVIILALPVGIGLVRQQQIISSRAQQSYVKFIEGKCVVTRNNLLVATCLDPITVEAVSPIGPPGTPEPTPTLTPSPTPTPTPTPTPAPCSSDGDCPPGHSCTKIYGDSQGCFDSDPTTKCEQFTTSVCQPKSPTGNVLEAEAMTGGGNVFDDTNASGGKARKFTKKGTASGEISGTGKYIVVRAQAKNCSGWPNLVIKIDGKKILGKTIKSTSWQEYFDNPKLSDAKHTVEIQSTGEKQTSTCTRELMVDKITISDQKPLSSGEEEGGLLQNLISVVRADDECSNDGNPYTECSGNSDTYCYSRGGNFSKEGYVIEVQKKVSSCSEPYECKNLGQFYRTCGYSGPIIKACDGLSLFGTESEQTRQDFLAENNNDPEKAANAWVAEHEKDINYCRGSGTPTPKPTKTSKPTKTPQPTKTSKPTKTPKPTKTSKPTPSSSGGASPSATSSATPAPAGEKTSFYRFAETPDGLSDAPQIPYTTEPAIINFKFSDDKKPEKFIFIEFIGSKGTTLRKNASIKFVGPDPQITSKSCSTSLGEDGVRFKLTGNNFGGEQGQLLIDDSDVRINRWDNNTIDALLKFSLGQLDNVTDFPLTVKRVDGTEVKTVCTLGQLEQLEFGTKLFCRKPSDHAQEDVALVIVQEPDTSSTEASGSAVSKPKKETVSVDKKGKVQGLQTKFEPGRIYTISVKAPTSLRRIFTFTAEEGANIIPDMVLPVGDIFPLDGGDGVINSADKAELNREWGESRSSTKRNGDFNRDDKVNSFDWACMRYDFNSRDDPEL